MASISAGSFINPRLASQVLGSYLIDMVGRSSESTKEYVLNVIVDGDLIELYGAKAFRSADGQDLLGQVDLPWKMTLAMYHQAVAKGYLR